MAIVVMDANLWVAASAFSTDGTIASDTFEREGSLPSWRPMAGGSHINATGTDTTGHHRRATASHAVDARTRAKLGRRLGGGQDRVLFAPSEQPYGRGTVSPRHRLYSADQLTEHGDSLSTVDRRHRPSSTSETRQHMVC